MDEDDVMSAISVEVEPVNREIAVLKVKILDLEIKLYQAIKKINKLQDKYDDLDDRLSNNLK